MVDRTYRASMAPPIEKPLNPERSEILSQLLMKMASQSQPIARPGDPPAVAWQPAMNILASALAGKKADRLQGQKSNRLAQLLGEVTSPVQEVTPGTQPEVLPQGVSGPTRPGTPDIVTERPRTLDETIGLLGQSPEGQPMANEVLLHRLKQQIESKFAKSASGRGVTDNDLYIVATGGQSGNPSADSLGVEGAKRALREKPPVMYPEGSYAWGRGTTPPSGHVNKKLLARQDLDDLREASIAFDSVKNLTDTFKPEFAGKNFEVLADASTWLAARGNDASPQANWVRKYESLNMIERHKLFGSALTATEVESWNKSKASLAQGSGNMKEHLKNLEKKSEKVLSYIAKPRMIDRFDQDQVREAIGNEAYDRLKGVETNTTQPMEEVEFVRDPATGKIVRKR